MPLHPSSRRNRGFSNTHKLVCVVVLFAETSRYDEPIGTTRTSSDPLFTYHHWIFCTRATHSVQTNGDTTVAIFASTPSILDLDIPVWFCFEITLFEMMHPHETVFSPRRVACPRRVDSDAERKTDQRGEKRRPVEFKLTYVLMGPKWPFTRPTSSSKTLCQNRVSNLPCRSDVVVTLIASCPPPRSTCGRRD
jgi:hypothetical protein